MVSLDWGHGASTITLVPDSSGLGGGTVSTDDGDVELHWVSTDEVSVKMTAKNGAASVQTFAVGHSEMRTGDAVLQLDSRTETL